MQLTNVTVRFLKRYQPVQFEPAEAEVSASVAFSEVETDVEANIAAASDLFRSVRREVYTALNRTPPDEPTPPPSAKKIGVKTEDTTIAGGKGGKKTTKTPPTGAETADFGDAGETAPQAQAPAQQTAPAQSKPAPQQAAPSVNISLTLPELQKHLSGLVNSGKVTPDKVKALYPGFKVNRVAELKDDQIAAFKVALDNLEKEGSSGLADL
jgi:hypothetical protein